MRAELITIGNEILIGQIVDTNSAWMAKQLNELGIHIQQITSVSDQESDIIMALTLAAGRADIILVTGGLGPTKDDVTKQALCSYFGCGLRRDEEVLRHVERFFARSNKPMLAVNQQQADVLEIAEVIFNELGTAPGMWVKFKNKQYMFMPGVPFEMKHLMEVKVLPRLKLEENRIPIQHVHMLIAGIGESFLAEKLKDIEVNLPSNLSLAYLPSPGVIRLRLTGIGTESTVLKQQLNYFTAQIKQAAGIHFIAQEETDLEQAVIDLLTETETRVSTAESCTGGNIAKLITAKPGSSQIFPGGAVTYSNEAKMNLLGVRKETLDAHGAVSEETVIEMAEGCKRFFSSDYAIAVSGIAGPGGATPEKPVGTVWIAVAGKNQVITRLYQFGKDRSVNVARASSAALFELFVLIKSENIR